MESEKLDDGYYWVKFKDEEVTKNSKFLQGTEGWLIGYYMWEHILINGFPYKLEKFEVDLKKIER